MSRFTERIIFSLIGLVALGWTVFHIVNYYNKPFRTEAVFEYTVSQTVYARGVAVRDEFIIEQTVSGIENYLFEDSEHVSVGETVAEFYSSSKGDRSIKRMREIEAELEMLEKAEDKNVNNYSSADTLNREIRGQLAELSTMSNTGQYRQAQDVKWELVNLLNRRQIATGKAEDFSERINSLRDEYSRLERGTSGENADTVSAPVSGAFIKTIDGYENTFTSAALQDYGIEDYSSAVNGEKKPGGSRYVGKILRSPIWHFAAVTSRHNTENVKAGQTVILEFPDLAIKVPAQITDVLIDNKLDESVIMLKCGQLSADIVNIRVEEAAIHFTSYTGLRINTPTIRFQGEQKGVYIVEENTVRFKKVTPIYEEAGFILSEMNIIDTPGYDPEAVSLFAQAVTKGTDLYDGKTIQ